MSSEFWRRRKRTPKAKKPGVHVRPLQRSYQQRKEALSDLGFKSYAAYLRSPLWASIKSRVLADNPYCIRCGSIATQVHHAVYSVMSLSGEKTDRLYSICGDCHEKAEKDQLGKKTTVGRANRFLGIIDREGKWTGRTNTWG